MFRELLHRIAANPRVYEWIQATMGLPVTQALLRDRLSIIPHDGRVIDIGGGTGLYRSCLPPTSTYACLDIDAVKLQGFRARNHSDTAILGDATRLPLQSRSVDAVLCVAVTHHLPDNLKAELVGEALRIVKEDGFLILLDAVWDARRLRSRLLWAYDRGSYPGTEETLRSVLSLQARCIRWESYSIHHRYILGIFSPLPSQLDSVRK